MSIIGVKGIPYKWSIKQCVKILLKKIKGPFEPINFKQGYGNSPVKTLFLRVSEKLDPQYVVETINKAHFTGAGKLTAFVPSYVPDLPLARAKPKKLPKRLQRAISAPKTIPPGEVLVTTHRDIMDELQYKYTGLFKLSKGTSHKLLDEIARTIFERLKLVLDTDKTQQCSALSKSYRKTYPHFGDFQLILSTLHRVQDAAGEQRTQIAEPDLAVVCTQPNVIGNIPFTKVLKATDKYSELIITKITEHINGLNAEINTDSDPEEEIARKKVRAELKKLVPYLPVMVKQILTDNCVKPEKTPFNKFRIYGEPFLPAKETMHPFLRKYNTIKPYRSDRMFNMLMFFVPTTHYSSLMAMDGTILGGAKLIIRPSDMTLYKVPDTLLSELTGTAKEQKTTTQPQAKQDSEHEEYEEMELPQDEEWNEAWD